MIIGITGSIGSGKTTTAKIFSRRHFIRIDADEIGHGLIKKNSYHYKKIISKFGNDILDKNKNIERKKLGSIVFNDSEKLRKLNSIMLPAIINEIKNQILKIKRKCGDKTKIIIDATLLLETKTKNFVDKIIVIRAGRDKIMKRLGKKFPKERIERILNTQMPLDEKLKHADFVIDNDKDLTHLEQQAINIIHEIEFKK